MLLEAIAGRLAAEIPDLASRVQGAAELAALVAAGRGPQATPAAYVVPLGFRAAGGESVTGLFTQVHTDSVAVVLFLRTAGDATGARSLPKLEELANAVLDALAGWQPEHEGAWGVLTPTSADLLGLNAGAVTFQLTFTIQRLLRISR